MRTSNQNCIKLITNCKNNIKHTKIIFVFNTLFFLLISNLSFANDNVNKIWCFGNATGYQPGSHPLPGLKNSFDPCPGKHLKKMPFDRVKTHFSNGEGKQHICNMIDGASPFNERLTVYFDLVAYLKIECKDKAKEEEKKRKEMARLEAKEKERKIASEKARKEKERKRQIEIEKEKRVKAEQERIKKKAIELARKKREEEIAREKKLAAKKAEEKRKKNIAAKEKQKKMAEQERKRKEAEDKINEKMNDYKRKSENFYKDIENFVKSGGNVDLVKLSDFYDTKPNPYDEWNKKDLSRYEKLREFMTSIPQYVSFEKERIGARLKDKFAARDQSIVELKKNLTELKVLMRKMFGSGEIPKIKDMIKDIKSTLSNYNQAIANKVLSNSSSYIASKLSKPKDQNKTTKVVSTLEANWTELEGDLTIQQQQFCQLTDRFYNDLNKARTSKNEIKVNMVHKERQENLDALIPQGRINNWIFKVIKIDQVEDGSAAVVLGLQCRSYVGSGQTIDIKRGMSKKDKKEWRATIPYDDRRFRELAKLDQGQFIVGSGTMLEINAYKPGQKETFYASQQIGEHPLTKGLNLQGELFIADLSYIAALN